jgi:DDE family transposase
MMGIGLSAPDHTTLSRRGQYLNLTLDRASIGKGVHLIVDSTGLSILGEGEWAAAKHGGHGIASVTGDAACDSIASYDAACARGASVVVPPTKAPSGGNRPVGLGSLRRLRFVHQRLEKGKKSAAQTR